MTDLPMPLELLDPVPVVECTDEPVTAPDDIETHGDASAAD